jgi:aspartate kinase
MSLPCLIQRFSTASIADHETLRGAARQVAAAYRRGFRVVVVVWAGARTTETLIALARQVHQDPPPRELDMLLATAGQASVALMAMAIHELGVPVVSFTGTQAGILTDSVHTRAAIRGLTPTRVQQALDAGRVVVVAGGQGNDDRGEITTFGPGKSHKTALALARVLDEPA